MGIKLIRAEDRIGVRRVRDCRRSPPPGKTGRNDSSTLHRRSSPLSKPLCLSPPPLPSRRNFRSSDKNSCRDRSKSLIVEKPPVKNLVMENVVILKRQTVSKNHQSAESVTPPSSPPEKPVGGAAPDRCSTNQIQGELKYLQKSISPVSRKPQLYAGSGFFTSPAPSSLPKPPFFEKKEVASSVDLATKSLSFLLCLDVV